MVAEGAGGGRPAGPPGEEGVAGRTEGTTHYQSTNLLPTKPPLSYLPIPFSLLFTPPPPQRGQGPKRDTQPLPPPPVPQISGSSLGSDYTSSGLLVRLEDGLFTVCIGASWSGKGPLLLYVSKASGLSLRDGRVAIFTFGSFRRQIPPYGSLPYSS